MTAHGIQSRAAFALNGLIEDDESLSDGHVRVTNALTVVPR